MIKISKDEFGDIMEHLHKVKKHLKKACELIEEGSESGYRRGMSGRRSEHMGNRFEDDDED